MRELDRVEGTAGEDVQLTIDLALQDFAMQRMAGQSAAAVVIDVTNGDIVALASAPGFDPNNFVFGIKSGDWNALLNDEYRPLSNKTVAGTYPPGSTFKMIVALAALDGGRRQPRRRRLLRRRHLPRQPPVPLLEARRPRHRRPAPQPRAVLRLLLLRDGAPGRPRRHLGDGARSSAWASATTCRCRRSPRA